MVLSKIDLVLVAAVAGGTLWIEHEHRTRISTPTAIEDAGMETSACPDSDTVPFGADCLTYIRRGASSDGRLRVTATVIAPITSTDSRGTAESHVPACPASNENEPYSAKCLKFLSGWFWHPEGTP